MLVNGVDLSSKDEIKVGLLDFIRTCFEQRGEWPPGLDGVQFDMLSAIDSSKLEQPFSKEVAGALSMMNGDKAPGLGGFTMVSNSAGDC
ncbi:hypothetical protein CsSME_00053165 [Camellia sinensis var. sinensis]